MSQISIRIEGMHCGACVRRATQALNAVPDAVVEEVRIGAARVNLPEDQQPAALIAALGKAGFAAHPEE